MADGKKKISVDMKLDIFSEFNKRPVATWIKMDPNLKKVIVPIPIKEHLELDPRKWNKAKLEAGIKAVARYELKLFATSATDLHTKISKATKNSQKVQEKCEADLVKNYKSIRKDIEDKISLALEEVEADKGDSKKALKEGKAAFSGMPTKAAIEKVYAKPQDEVVKAIGTLEAMLRKAEDKHSESVVRVPPKGETVEQKKEREDEEKKAALKMERARDGAFAEAARMVENQRTLYNAGKKDLEQAMTDLEKLGDQIKRNKDLPPEFMTFHKTLLAEKKDFLEAKADLQAFDTTLSDCVNDFKRLKGDYGKQGRTSKDAAKRKKRIMNGSGSRNSSAQSLANCIIKLKGDFALLEKKWK